MGADTLAKIVSIEFWRSSCFTSKTTFFIFAIPSSIKDWDSFLLFGAPGKLGTEVVEADFDFDFDVSLGFFLSPAGTLESCIAAARSAMPFNLLSSKFLRISEYSFNSSLLSLTLDNNVLSRLIALFLFLFISSYLVETWLSASSILSAYCLIEEESSNPEESSFLTDSTFFPTCACVRCNTSCSCITSFERSDTLSRFEIVESQSVSNELLYFPTFAYRRSEKSCASDLSLKIGVSEIRSRTLISSSKSEHVFSILKSLLLNTEETLFIPIVDENPSKTFFKSFDSDFNVRSFSWKPLTSIICSSSSIYFSSVYKSVNESFNCSIESFTFWIDVKVVLDL